MAGDLGLQIPITELTHNEVFQIAGDSNTTATKIPMVPQDAQEPTMSQTMNLFGEDHVSDEPLKYFGEPLDQSCDQTTLTPKLDRIMGETSHFNEPEGAQVRATQTETVEIHLDPVCHTWPTFPPFPSFLLEESLLSLSHPPVPEPVLS